MSPALEANSCDKFLATVCSQRGKWSLLGCSAGERSPGCSAELSGLNQPRGTCPCSPSPYPVPHWHMPSSETLLNLHAWPLLGHFCSLPSQGWLLILCHLPPSAPCPGTLLPTSSEESGSWSETRVDPDSGETWPHPWQWEDGGGHTVLLSLTWVLRLWPM